jgi:hypothetical protein
MYTWLFPWEQISPNKIPFMFIFLIYHGILPVPINNYSNAIKVTKCWTPSLCKNTIIKELYYWASPYTNNRWWCTVDCGWVYHKRENIYKYAAYHMSFNSFSSIFFYTIWVCLHDLPFLVMVMFFPLHSII